MSVFQFPTFAGEGGKISNKLVCIETLVFQTQFKLIFLFPTHNAHRGRSRIFSRGGGVAVAGFHKKLENFVDIFLGRPISFSELCQIIKKTVI